MGNLHYYENMFDFNREYYGSAYEEPWTSMVERDTRGREYPVFFNHTGSGGSIAQALWIDDFPDGEDWIWEEEGYGSFEEYITDYVEDPESFGGNLFSYIGEMEFDDEEFLVYYYTDGNQDLYGLMPTPYTSEFLQPNTIESNHSNRFEPFTYILDSDIEIRYVGGDDDEGYCLVKIADDESD